MYLYHQVHTWAQTWTGWTARARRWRCGRPWCSAPTSGSRDPYRCAHSSTTSYNNKKLVTTTKLKISGSTYHIRANRSKFCLFHGMQTILPIICNSWDRVTVSHYKILPRMRHVLVPILLHSNDLIHRDTTLYPMPYYLNYSDRIYLLLNRDNSKHHRWYSKSYALRLSIFRFLEKTCKNAMS